MAELREISALAEAQLKLEDEVATLEEQLAVANAALRAIAEDALPEAMLLEGLTEIKLTNGRVVSISRSYHASIPKARAAEAFEWLRSNGYDGIIKRTISFAFGKGEDTLASTVLAKVAEAAGKNLDVKDVENVHPQTLKAFVRERMEDGDDFPVEAFGVFVQRRAKIGVVAKV